MAKRIGILTSGGDSPGLNAAIRGVARASHDLMNAEIIGIENGFRGLIERDARTMHIQEFSNILTLGGTILGTSRQPFKMIRESQKGPDDKVARMVHNYEKLGLDCLVTLGGNGTHKTANLLREQGLNIVALPKTIDNDIYGTDVTFGFHSALETATDVIDRIHTTALAHGRIMVVELMGNKVGWLTLFTGVASGSDIILLPEIPYKMDSIIATIENRRILGKRSTIIAVAEGALSQEEATLSKKQLKALRSTNPYPSVAYPIARQIEATLSGAEVRVVVPGHIQRGGSPSAYDRVLATRFGAHAAELIRHKDYGKTVALVGNCVTSNALKDVAGMPKPVPPDHELLHMARLTGSTFGE